VDLDKAKEKKNTSKGSKKPIIGTKRQLRKLKNILKKLRVEILRKGRK